MGDFIKSTDQQLIKYKKHFALSTTISINHPPLVKACFDLSDSDQTKSIELELIGRRDSITCIINDPRSTNKLVNAEIKLNEEGINWKKKIVLPDLLQVVAITGIKKGDEIFIDYGKEFWGQSAKHMRQCKYINKIKLYYSDIKNIYPVCLFLILFFLYTRLL